MYDDAHNEAEVVLLGTSPLVLAHALRAVEAGRRPLILERSAVAGGAWRWGRVSHFDNVELAVHLIENRPAVHRTLRALGVSLVEASDAHEGRIGRLRVPLAFARMALFAGVMAKSLRAREFGKARVNARSLRRAIWNARSPFFYPERGSSGLVRALLDRLAERGVTPYYGVDVKSAAFEHGGANGVLATTRGEIRFQRLVLTSRAYCAIRLNGVALQHAVRHASTRCMALHVRGLSERLPAYLELVGHPSIRRLRNLTPFVEPIAEHDEAVLSIQVRHCATALETIAHLRALRVLPERAQLVDSRVEDFEIETIPDEELKRLRERVGERLEVVPSTDFAEEFVGLARGA